MQKEKNRENEGKRWENAIFQRNEWKMAGMQRKKTLKMRKERINRRKCNVFHGKLEMKQ